MKFNIIFSKRDEYTDYMRFYRTDMVNVFIGKRNSGISFSIKRFLADLKANKNVTITEYEKIDLGFSKIVHDFKSIHKVTLGQFVMFPQIKNGDVLSINASENELLVNELLSSNEIKYSIFIH